jgi:acyl-CoA reductase-like NAD-dependent aldehyde dehydrogenase
MFIGGEWRAGSAQQEIDVVNPATETSRRPVRCRWSTPEWLIHA